MKKNLIYLLAVAAAAIACTKEADFQTIGSGRTVFSCTSVDTRISLGDKTGDTYPALWQADDRIDIYNASDNSLIGTATLSPEYAGMQQGEFILDRELTDGTVVKVVYPAGDGFAVPAEQEKDSADDKTLVTKAESGDVTVQGGKASFTLSHQCAIIKVDVSSSEFSGMLLKSVCLYSASATVSDQGDYARVTYGTPAAVSADGTVSAVFAARPITESKDFYVAVKLVDATDALSTVCIPKKFSGKQLNAGKVTRVDFTSLATSDNAVAWYNPSCKRYIPEGGWCYGSSTTMVVPPTANATANWDVRACGDFLDVIRYAAEPKSLQLRCGDVVNTGNAGVWTVDRTTPKKNAYAAIKSYAPTILLTAAPKNGKKTVAGFFNLCDAENKIIWSFMFWGASPAETVYTNGTVMNMNLGGSSPDGALAEQRGSYYQWGRPFPFGYGSALQTVNTSLSITSYAISATNAHSIGVSDETNNDWWRDGTHKYDLWGNTETTNTSAGGKKSIFDPCPQGWKVASAAILNEVFQNAQYDETNKWYTYKGDVWPASSFYNGSTATRGSDSKGLYWADNALNDNHGLHFEFVNDGTDPVFQGTWRSNACAVRCMKDTENR